MNIRNTLLASVSAAAILALGACSQTGAASALATVQAEAKAINTAIGQLSPALIKLLPAVDQANATTAVVALNTAVTSMEAGNLSVTNARQDAEAVLIAAQQVTAILPLPASTSLAIQAGLGLVDAFVAALPLPATAPATVGASPDMVPGPIPIPLH